MVKVSVMGIINVTPDSFSGDGLLLDKDYVAHAVAHAEHMIDEGADILDIGGESSRPGAVSISALEEISRVAPVIAAIRRISQTPIAIDTIKAEVAEAALQAGATIINDISALAGDTQMGAVAARHKATVILMHNRASTAQYDSKIGGQYDAPDYKDVVDDVCDALRERTVEAMAAGIARDRIVLDPGIGFGKSPEQNMMLIKHISRIKLLGFPVLMGVSRKSFIGHVLDLPVEERLEGTAACVAACVMGGADIVRVHDVKAMARIVKMTVALRDA